MLLLSEEATFLTREPVMPCLERKKELRCPHLLLSLQRSESEWLIPYLSDLIKNPAATTATRNEPAILSESEEATNRTTLAEEANPVPSSYFHTGAVDEERMGTASTSDAYFGKGVKPYIHCFSLAYWDENGEASQLENASFLTWSSLGLILVLSDSSGRLGIGSAFLSCSSSGWYKEIRNELTDRQHRKRMRLSINSWCNT
ncbi:hypothetical protein VNO78_35245 [Psophocarpus tetragonolobus]|uniref:Uncharacterized protein n=1 Tax=Psophocarpus tetragonolobus TaxID=3891 RepID=A0AAN9NCR2_PSOTE